MHRLPAPLRQRVSAALFVFIGCVTVWSGATTLRSEDVSAIEARLADSVRYLASDELEGRGIGTKGLELASEYIAKEFSSLGLQTSLYDGAAFQKFTMITKVELGPKEQNRLTIAQSVSNEAQPRSVALKLDQEFSVLALGGSGKVSADLVFAGYGITAKDLEYDDYAGLDVKGKVVLLIRKEPQQNNPHSKFDGNRPSRHATFQSKIANAFEHGAAAVILVNDFQGIVDEEKSAEKRINEAADKIAESHAEFKKKESPSAEEMETHRAELARLAEQIQTNAKRLAEKNFDRLLGFNEAGIASGRRTMPVFFVSRKAIEPVVRAALGTDLAEVERQIDEDLKPRSQLMPGWKVEAEANVVMVESEVRNVIGVLPGEGPLADETIVVGAHYDHLGLGGRGNSLAPGTVAIHNGADDNASGTAGIIEIARQIVTQSGKNRRRIVFIAFTGEEEGLFGSAHYVKQPRFPLENTVAMVNLDMVGRLKDNKLIVYGTGTAAEFDGLVDELNKRHDFTLTKEPSGFGPSDHESFYAQKIPVFHLFTGTHNDYHRPSDDFERIDIPGMRRIVAFAKDLVTSIDALDHRPEYRETKRPQRAGGERPYLGSIPDFTRQVEGYALMGVAPDSPAAKAGMQAGDVIIQLGDSKIGNLDDIDSALRKYKAGNTVKVLVKRGEETKELNVTLGAPR